MGKSASIVSMVIDQANKSLSNRCNINTDREEEILSYCKDADKVIIDFDCSEFSARVRMDRPEPTVVFEFNTTYACTYSPDHPYFNLIKNSESLGIKWVNSETVCMWIEFKGAWEMR